MTNWLEKAQEAESQSTDFFDTNFRGKVDDNLRHFNNKHHASSKYNKSAYKNKSKNFAPKTRSSVRNNEAAASAVFFSNQDLVSIEPRNPNNPKQAASAAINRELINYRLTETIPWFMTCIGGFQDAQVVGLVCSKQYWEFEEEVEKIETPVLDGTGAPVLDEKRKSFNGRRRRKNYG